MMKAMKNLRMLAKVLTTLAAIVWQAQSRAAEADQEQPGSVVRIGVFDSRAVAIAYYRSPEFLKLVEEMRAKQRQAKEADDSATVRKLEAAGRQLQDLINRQGFGNAPIGDVIKRIENDLPKVAERVGVDVIVSRWDVAFQKSNTGFVDVTDQLVQLFAPDKRTREVVAELRKTKPVPSSELHIDK
jgi:hypothetical protein